MTWMWNVAFSQSDNSGIQQYISRNVISTLQQDLMI